MVRIVQIICVGCMAVAALGQTIYNGIKAAPANEQIATSSMVEFASQHLDYRWLIRPSKSIAYAKMQNDGTAGVEEKANAHLQRILPSSLYKASLKFKWQFVRDPRSGDILVKTFRNGEREIQFVDSSTALGICVRSDPMTSYSREDVIAEAMFLLRLERDRTEHFRLVPQKDGLHTGRIQHRDYVNLGEAATWKDAINVLTHRNSLYFGIIKRGLDRDQLKRF